VTSEGSQGLTLTNLRS